MANDPEPSFEALVAARQQLQSLCRSHYRSLEQFASGISFELHPVPVHKPEPGASSENEAAHLSSSVTCFESLLGCPQSSGNSLFSRITAFAHSAMQRPQAKWRSEKAADIYCRCRSLPLITRYLKDYDARLAEHLKCILQQLTHDPSRLAIGETSGESSSENWYPPNSYHTYWTLYLLSIFKERFEDEYSALCAEFEKSGLSIQRLKNEMLLWARQAAGNQIALHTADSSKLDSDQLAWSLTVVIQFDGDFQANLANQDFIQQGLRCLFAHQTPVGTWPTGTRLFHYPSVGNAYCYTFETFTFLLKSALTTRREGVFIRQILRPYLGKLLKLRDYATSTQIPISSHEETIGWSSGHRVNSTEPESWATASVYSFFQCLRRLTGIWARESVAEKRAVRPARLPDPGAIDKLEKRGDTWGNPAHSAANQLMTLFVNPARFYAVESWLEPDNKSIGDIQARAAILFGPPGTGKTTLSRSVAEAIGWNYVELHASDFVAEGLPEVQKTADRIFEQLMQLDQTVILFDEIDELVRAREMEADAFGRFLTTSMLPKLAELWDGRKVIYFVATNHIKFFDPAVTRAHRFDALVHVSPPSFDRKVTELIRLLFDNVTSALGAGFDCAAVEEALKRAAESEPRRKICRQPTTTALPDDCMLAKFLLMRWDQLNELAAHIKRNELGKTGVILDRGVLTKALAQLKDPSLRKCKPFKDYIDDQQYQQHDFGKVHIWEVRGDVPEECSTKVVGAHKKNWYLSHRSFDDFSDFLPGQSEIIAPGVIRIKASSAA